MKYKLIATLSLILSVWLIPATATTYRYIDENGVTIYSQSPPPSGKATIIKPPAPPVSSTDENIEKLKARASEMEKDRKEREAAKKEKKKSKEEAKNKSRRCENAKQVLASIEDRPRIKRKMADGDYKVIAGEELAAEIERAKKIIKENCN